MVKLLTNILTMKFHEILTKLNEILVKIRILQETIDRQIEKLKLDKVHQHNILWSSCKKFYPTGPEIMEKWLRKDGRTDGRTCTYIYMCSFFGAHKKITGPIVTF